MTILRFFGLPIIIALATLISGCGGSEDDSLVAGANYEQRVPSGSLSVGPGESAKTGVIVGLQHQVGIKQSRVTIAASVTGAKASAAATAAGTRWAIRNGTSVIAQGSLSPAPAGGAIASTSYELVVSGGSLISVEITGNVAGPGAVMQWDGASVSMTSTPL